MEGFKLQTKEAAEGLGPGPPLPGVPFPPGSPTACGPCPDPSPLIHMPTWPGGSPGRGSKLAWPQWALPSAPQSRSHPPAGPSLRLLWGAAQPGDIAAGLGGGAGPHPRDEVTGLPCPLSLSSPPPAGLLVQLRTGWPPPYPLSSGACLALGLHSTSEDPQTPRKALLLHSWRQGVAQAAPQSASASRVSGTQAPPSGQERRPAHRALHFGAVWPPGDSSAQSSAASLAALLQGLSHPAGQSGD